MEINQKGSGTGLYQNQQYYPNQNQYLPPQMNQQLYLPSPQPTHYLPTPQNPTRLWHLKFFMRNGKVWSTDVLSDDAQGDVIQRLAIIKRQGNVHIIKDACDQKGSCHKAVIVRWLDVLWVEGNFEYYGRKAAGA